MRHLLVLALLVTGCRSRHPATPPAGDRTTCALRHLINDNGPSQWQCENTAGIWYCDEETVGSCIWITELPERHPLRAATHLAM